MTRTKFAPSFCVKTCRINYCAYFIFHLKPSEMQPLKQRRSKVNGKFLQDFNGKDISILGEVIKVHAGSNTFELKTTDNCVVNVIMSKSFDEIPVGWVEVRGTAQGKRVVLGHHIIVFPSDIFQDFDCQLYDDVITVLNTFNNPWVNSD